MGLPEVYMITGADPLDRNTFLLRLEDRLKSGISLIQLRAKALALSDYKSLAILAIELCRRHHAKLILNAEAELVKELNADGMQLSSERLMSCKARPLAENKLVAASCHNLEELQQAEKIGADFVTLSPVLPTTSHPDAQSLGWDVFAKWVSEVSVPVYALGGVGRNDIAYAKELGATGVAAIRGFWGC